MYRNLLVPTDGSPLSLKAAKAAAGLAQGLGARITAVFVMEPFEPQWAAGISAFAPDAINVKAFDKRMRETGERALEKVAIEAGKKGIACGKVLVADRDPWKSILKAAKAKKCDLVVMSSNGRRGLEGLLLGSQTQKVLAHSRLPVLVIR